LNEFDLYYEFCQKQNWPTVDLAFASSKLRVLYSPLSLPPRLQAASITT
jgi:hypothetical protein